MFIRPARTDRLDIGVSLAIILRTDSVAELTLDIVAKKQFGRIHSVLDAKISELRRRLSRYPTENNKVRFEAIGEILSSLNRAIAYDTTMRAAISSLNVVEAVAEEQKSTDGNLSGAGLETIQLCNIINRLLRRYGFQFQYANGEGRARIELTALPEVRATLSPLDQFLLSPDYETAIVLADSHGEAVKQIFLAESSQDTPDASVISAAMKYFNESGDYSSLLVVAKANSGLNLDDGRQWYLAYAYYMTGDIGRARQIFQGIDPQKLEIDEVYYYLSIGFNLFISIPDLEGLTRAISRVPRSLMSDAMCDYTVTIRDLCRTPFLPAVDQESLRALMDKLEGYQNDTRLMEEVRGKFQFLPTYMFFYYVASCWIDLRIGRFDWSKSCLTEIDERVVLRPNPVRMAMEALVAEAKGEIDGAKQLAKEALGEIGRGIGTAKNKEVLLFSRCSAIMARLKALASQDMVKRSADFLIREVSEVEKADAAIDLRPTVREMVPAEAWERFWAVLPARFREDLTAKLLKINTDCLELLGAGDLTDLAKVSLLKDRPETKRVVQTLGLRDVTLQVAIDPRKIKVTFYLERAVQGLERIDGELSGARLQVEGADASEAGFPLEGALFFQALILEGMVESVYGSRDGIPSVEDLFHETEVVEVAVSPEPPIASIVDGGPVVAPPLLPTIPSIREPVETRGVQSIEPTERAVSPEREALKTRNINAFLSLLQGVVDARIDLEEQVPETMQQIFDLLDILRDRRDTGENLNGFSVVPSPADPLRSFILGNIRLYGPRQGIQILQENGLLIQHCQEYGFTTSEASSFLSVGEITFKGNQRMLLIIDRKGNLIIPGVGQSVDQITFDQLHRTVLECLALATVPALAPIYGRNGLTSAHPVVNGQPRGSRRDVSRPRQKIISITSTPRDVTSALRAIAQQVRRRMAIDSAKVLNLSLWTLEGEHFRPFPDDRAERQKLFSSLSPDQIYVQVGADYAYRLPLQVKIDEQGQFYFPPKLMSPLLMLAASKSPVKMDFATRLMLYVATEIIDPETAELTVRLTPTRIAIIPQTDELPPLTLGSQDYERRQIGEHLCLVPADVDQKLVEQLLALPQAAMEQRLLIEGPSYWGGDNKSYFLVAWVERGYNRGEHQPLSNLLETTPSVPIAA